MWSHVPQYACGDQRAAFVESVVSFYLYLDSRDQIKGHQACVANALTC